MKGRGLVALVGMIATCMAGCRGEHRYRIVEPF